MNLPIDDVPIAPDLVLRCFQPDSGKAMGCFRFQFYEFTGQSGVAQLRAWQPPIASRSVPYHRSAPHDAEPNKSDFHLVAPELISWITVLRSPLRTLSHQGPIQGGSFDRVLPPPRWGGRGGVMR
jgi:hypothetical protein